MLDAHTTSQDRILDAAKKVFAARGFRGGSLNDVAVLAGYTRAGLLHHFPSKESLLLALLERRDSRIQQVAPIPATPMSIFDMLDRAERAQAVVLADRVVAWISDERRQVVRSWIGGDGIYDPDKMLDQIRGIQTIDWDAEQETVLAQPFAAFVVHDAYAAAGRPDLIAAAIRRWSVFLEDGYDTFGECWGWGTPAHGWSSTPTRDLVQSILGVTPAEPGFTRARVASGYGIVQRMTSSVPTPHGLIHVRVDGDVVDVDSPVPCTLVKPDGSEVTIAARRTPPA